MLAFLALEMQAEGIFQRLPKAGQGREIGLLDAKARVMGVGGENAGHVLRSGQRRIMEQHTLQILQHPFAMLRLLPDADGRSDARIRSRTRPG